jgi:diketogulonate reductase-like aldo/keto reductase
MVERLQFPRSWQNPGMPGYGTFPAPFVSTLGYEKAARLAQEAVEQALVCGYRHLDTAFAYRNQDLVGAAVRAQGLGRSEVFVTSKLHPYNNTHAEALDRINEAVRVVWGEGGAGTQRYMDAFLIHYPGFGDPVAAWKGVLEARTQGSVKHAGVSNFEIGHVEKLHAGSGQYPEINQIELHPYIYREQTELIAFCQTKGIALEGYCPLAEGEVLEDPELRTIAQMRKTSVASVALRWCMQHGVRPIVGTRNASHIEANAEAGAVQLSQEEMARIDRLSSSKTVRVSLRWHWNPKTAPLGGPIPNGKLQTLLRRCSSLLGRR